MDYNFYKFSLNERYYSNVSASTTETHDYTPANGEKIVIVRCGGDCATTPETSVVVVWDPGGGEQEIIMATYRDIVHENVNKTFTGDGSKKLRIMLINDLTESSYAGGWVQGEII